MKINNLRLALNASLRLLVVFKSCFLSSCYCLVDHKELLGCSVTFHSSTFLICCTNPALASPDMFHLHFLCSQNSKGVHWNFCNPRTCVCILGRQIHVTSSGSMRDPTPIPTANPWFWFVLSLSVCVLHCLNAFELNAFRSPVYNVATSTMSRLALPQKMS